MTYRVGVDVGGTFTDIVLFDAQKNAMSYVKTPSTPKNQALGVEQGIAKVARREVVEPSAIAFLAHGTTVATNALLERRGVRCALITTWGFRDVLQIARQDRPKLYDWRAHRPEPLVPRHLRFEVAERMLHTGEVLVPLDEASALKAILAAKAEGVTAVAICLLHAYANPAHERRLAALVREHFPAAEVSISSEILPEFKEYERLSTTVVNAYVMPIMRAYLTSLEDRVRSIGVRAELHIMQSNGGIMTARAAGEKSVRTVLSGPAAGVLGAVSLARQAGFENVLTVDMGGTSFDVCLTHRGAIRYTKESEIGQLPIKVPMIDIHTLGAGGGSVAWIDLGGALRVGPHSAGADPGPACYGHGGVEPTVTDANVVLGRLDPDYFLGGDIRLDREAAHRAIDQRIAMRLGLTVEQAAEGIVRVINATMAKGMRVVSVEKGFDPRDFVLVAFGGGGPVHAADLARELGAPEVLVPIAPGVTSAVGLLMADFRYDFSATYMGVLDGRGSEALMRLYADLERQALEQMAREHVPHDLVALSRSAEVRYRGQGFELDVVVPTGVLDPAALERVRDEFHRLHKQHYGYAMVDEEVMVVNVQVTALGQIAKPQLNREPLVPARDDLLTVAVKGRRAMFVDGATLSATVYDRARLAPGAILNGPAIVEQADSTTLLMPEDAARVDGFRNLIVRVG